MPHLLQCAVFACCALLWAQHASAQISADGGAPTWPDQATLSVSMHQMLYDAPARTEAELIARRGVYGIGLIWPEASGATAYRLTRDGVLEVELKVTAEAHPTRWSGRGRSPHRWTLIAVGPDGQLSTPLTGHTRARSLGPTDLGRKRNAGVLGVAKGHKPPKHRKGKKRRKSLKLGEGLVPIFGRTPPNALMGDPPHDSSLSLSDALERGSIVRPSRPGGSGRASPLRPATGVAVPIIPESPDGQADPPQQAAWFRLMPKPPIIEGRLDPEQARRIARRHSRHLGHCAQTHLKTPGLMTITMQITVDDHGKVTAATLQPTDPPLKASFTACLDQQIKTWRYPGGAASVIQQPIVILGK